MYPPQRTSQTASITIPGHPHPYHQHQNQYYPNINGTNHPAIASPLSQSSVISNSLPERKLHTSQSHPHLRQHYFAPSSLPVPQLSTIYANSPEPSRAELEAFAPATSYPPASIPYDSSAHIHNNPPPTSSPLGISSPTLTSNPFQHQYLPLSHQPHPQSYQVSQPSIPNPASSLIGVSLSRSVSADAAAPQHSNSAHLVQRLAQQNKSIREAWEAERNYLEANRRRAEEVYQEERIIMEEERTGWDNERSDLHRQTQALMDRIHHLEAENSSLRTFVANRSAQAPGVMSPSSSYTGAIIDRTSPPQRYSAPADTSAPRGSSILKSASMSSPPVTSQASQLSPTGDGHSKRPHFVSSDGAPQAPTTVQESSPFIPLDPRMQPQKPVADFLSPGSQDTDGTPVPIIDVQEIDPKLEGIPLKVTAVSKYTFAGPSSSKASPATSPPAVEQRVEPFGSSPPSKRVSSKDSTLQVLRAEESERRTMHAGHTPNHSLSLFPTISATNGSNTTGEPTERTTPTAAQSSAPTEHNDLQDDEDLESPEKGISLEPTTTLDDLEPTLEPKDDVPLKGPLMLKNIPAKDELFLGALNKKLTTIREGELEGLPTVLLSPQIEPLQVGSASSASSVPDLSQEDLPNAEAVIEDPVPLKFKTTNNFGAPFGKR